MDNPTLNLNIVKTETAPCCLALKVEILPPRVKKSFGEVVAMFSKQVKIPGFRAGKVPTAVICKRFPEEVVEETKKKLIDGAFSDVIRQENLKMLGEPELTETDTYTVGQDTPFCFTAQIEVMPDFQLPEYKGLNLTRTKYVANEASVDELIASLQERNTKYDKADKPAAEKDMVRANYTAEVPEGVEITDKSKYILNGENSWLVLKTPEMLPGMTAALTGHVAGDELDADITFPEDHYNKEIAGKTFKYHVTVNEVHAATVPAADDELAKTVGADTMEQLRQRIADNQKAQADSQATEQMKEQVSDFLAAAVDFPLPPKILENQKNNIAARNYSNALRNGSTKEELEPKKDEMLAEAEAEAVKMMRLEFVIDAIANEEKINVEQNEMLEVVQQYAQMQGVKLEDMVKQLRENNGFPSLYQNIRYQKTLAAIVKLGNVTEVEPQA